MYSYQFYLHTCTNETVLLFHIVGYMDTAEYCYTDHKMHTTSMYALPPTTQHHHHPDSSCEGILKHEREVYILLRGSFHIDYV